MALLLHNLKRVCTGPPTWIRTMKFEWVLKRSRTALCTSCCSQSQCVAAARRSGEGQGRGRVNCFHSWLAHNPLLEPLPLPAPLPVAPNCAAWCALADRIQLRTAWIMTTRITSRTMSRLRLLLESRSRCDRFNWSRVSWIRPSRSSMERVWSRTGFRATSRRCDTLSSLSSRLQGNRRVKS